MLCASCLLGSPRGQAAERRHSAMADHLWLGQHMAAAAAGPAGCLPDRSHWRRGSTQGWYQGSRYVWLGQLCWHYGSSSCCAACCGAASGCGVECRHIAGAGAKCEHTAGRLEQQVLWDLLRCCMRQAEGKHYMTTLCSKTWLDSSARHQGGVADAAHVPFMARWTCRSGFPSPTIMHRRSMFVHDAQLGHKQSTHTYQY